MQSIYEQLIAFSVTVGIGFLAGILFDIYRVIRGLWRPRSLGTLLGDIVFWVIMTALVFILLLFGNWADIRVYVFLGIFLGYYGYSKKLSVKTQILIRKACIFLIKAFEFFWKVLSWPFKIVLRILKIPVGFIVASLLGSARFLVRLIKKRPKNDE